MRNFSDKADNTAPLDSGILTAAEDNVRFKELENAVSSAGITLDGPTGPDTDFTMLAQAMARYASGGIMCQDSGAADTYVLSSVGNFIMPKAYFKGMILRFYPGYSNTSTAPTATAFGLGVKTIYGPDGAPVAANDIQAGYLTELTYDPTLTAGAGGWKLSPWSVQLANISGGTAALYQGRKNGKHLFRPLLAGTNVTIDLVETAPSSGDYRVRISAASGGGGGGGANPLANVGSGAQVFKGDSGGYNNLRSITQSDGITVTQNTDEIDVKLANIAAYTFLGNNTGGAVAPAALNIAGLTERTAPADNDWLLLGLNADGAFRKVAVSAIRPGGLIGGGRIAVYATTGSTNIGVPGFRQRFANAYAGQLTAGSDGAGGVRMTFTFDTPRADIRYIPMVVRGKWSGQGGYGAPAGDGTNPFNWTDIWTPGNVLVSPTAFIRSTTGFYWSPARAGTGPSDDHDLYEVYVFEQPGATWTSSISE